MRGKAWARQEIKSSRQEAALYERLEHRTGPAGGPSLVGAVGCASASGHGPGRGQRCAGAHGRPGGGASPGVQLQPQSGAARQAVRPQGRGRVQGPAATWRRSAPCGWQRRRRAAAMPEAPSTGRSAAAERRRWGAGRHVQPPRATLENAIGRTEQLSAPTRQSSRWRLTPAGLPRLTHAHSMSLPLLAGRHRKLAAGSCACIRWQGRQAQRRTSAALCTAPHYVPVSLSTLTMHSVCSRRLAAPPARLGTQPATFPPVALHALPCMQLHHAMAGLGRLLFGRLSAAASALGWPPWLLPRTSCTADRALGRCAGSQRGAAAGRCGLPGQSWLGLHRLGGAGAALA